MFRLKRVIVGAAAAMLCALAMATPANAANAKGTCVIAGEVKTSDKERPTIGVRLVGGKGNFAYRSLIIICAGIAKGAPDTEFVTVDARGVYENVVCGTGKAWGTVMAVQAADPKYADLVTGQKFAIHFLGGEGSFFWHHWNKPPVPDLKDPLSDITKPQSSGFPWEKVKQEKNWQPAGSLKLTITDPLGNKPPRIVPSLDECTKAFTVSGVVNVDF